MVSQGRLRLTAFEYDQLGSELGYSPSGDCFNVLLGSVHPALLATGKLGGGVHALFRSPKLGDPGVQQ